MNAYFAGQIKTSMTTKLIIPFLFLCAAIVGCSSSSNITFTAEKGLESGYDAYKTYAFLPTTDTNYAKMINRQQLVPLLVTEGREELEKKGLRLDTAHPDCLFTYHLVMNRKYEADQQTETVYNAQVLTPAETPMYNDYGSGISGSSVMRSGTGAGSNVYYFSSDNKPYTYNGKMSIDTLREGSMVIDMIDAKTKKVIWRSVAEGKNKETAVRPLAETVKYIIPAMLRKLPRK
jgi:hypothetical protein